MSYLQILCPPGELVEKKGFIHTLVTDDISLDNFFLKKGMQ